VSLRLLDWCIGVGGKIFTRDAWHRVDFQALLYLFLWAAALRITFLRVPPIEPGDLVDTWTEAVWTISSLGCPPLALIAWWLITHATWRRATLAGMWLRLGADVGQFTALLVFHVATARTMMTVYEVGIYVRYLTAAALLYILLLIGRDVWSLVATERVRSML